MSFGILLMSSSTEAELGRIRNSLSSVDPCASGSVFGSLSLVEGEIKMARWRRIYCRDKIGPKCDFVTSQCSFHPSRCARMLAAHEVSKIRIKRSTRLTNFMASVDPAERRHRDVEMIMSGCSRSASVTSSLSL